MLQAGRSMWVRAGQRVVIEAWNASGASYFAWDPVFATAARDRLNQAIVLQPLADLRIALGLAGRPWANWRRGWASSPGLGCAAASAAPREAARARRLSVERAFNPA